MAIGKVNVGGSGGGRLNIFTGLTEPATKEGIWVKTGTPISSIKNDLELWFAGQWNDPVLKTYADMPVSIMGMGVAVLGNKIYTFGGYSGSTNTQRQVYAYDTSTNLWEQKSDIPVFGDTYFRSALTIGDYIYLLPVNGSYYFYRYDPRTDTYENLPSPISSGIATGARHFSTHANGKIYYITQQGTILYIYNIAMSSWENVSIPGNTVYLANLSGMFAVGGKIYFIHNHTTSAYAPAVYDILTRVFTKLDEPSPPTMQSMSSPVQIGSKVYILGGRHTNPGTLNVYDVASVFDFSSETHVVVPEMKLPYVVNAAGAAYVNGVLYLLGGGSGTTSNGIPHNPINKVMGFNFTSKEYEDGTFIIYRPSEASGNQKTELVTPAIPIEGVYSRILSYFDDVFFYENGTLQENPEAYYGDGTQWVKFKGGIEA